MPENLKEKSLHQLIRRVGWNVLADFLNIAIDPFEEQERNDRSNLQEIAIRIQLAGELYGSVIFAMSKKTATALAFRMYEVARLCYSKMSSSMQLSAIQEFGNWLVSGMASEYATQGIHVRILDSVLQTSSSLMLSERHPFMLTPLRSELGTIDVYTCIVNRAEIETVE